MGQYISYINYDDYSPSIWNQWYTPFPKDLSQIFAESYEKINKIFDSKIEKLNPKINIDAKKSKIATTSKAKKK